MGGVSKLFPLRRVLDLVGLIDELLVASEEGVEECDDGRRSLSVFYNSFLLENATI